ncbi:MAG: hypothetical protein U0350_00600 [Caldilineaceae bacterium]
MKNNIVHKWTVALLIAGVVSGLFWLLIAPVERVEAAGNAWTVTSPGDDVTDGNLVLHTGSLRFALAHAVSGDVIGFDIHAVDKLYPSTTLVVPPGVAVGRRRDQPCGSYKTPLINIDGQSLSAHTVISLSTGSTLRNVDIGWGMVSLRVAGADVDVCGVGLGLEADGEGNVTPLPASGIALAVDGDHAVIHQNYINGQVVVTGRGSDSRLGDALGGSGDTNDGVRDASVIVSTSAGGAAQRVMIRDPFPRLLQGMVGSGISGGDDIPTHANNWAQTPTILSAYTPDNFATVQVQGTANPFSVVDLYFDNQVTVARQPSVMADATGHFFFTGSLPGPDVLIMAASILNESAHPNRLGSSSQFSGVAHVTTTQPPNLIQLTPATLTFTGVVSTPLPAAQTVHVTAPALTWQAVVSPITATNWLSITPATGHGDGVISVTIKANTLPPGAHQATITVHDAAQPSNQATSTVTLFVQPRPAIQLTPATLSFTEVVSSVLPVTQTIFVTTPLTAWQTAVTTTGGVDWLHVTPATGNGNGPVAVVVQANALAPGSYHGVITVHDALQPSNQATTTVTLLVLTHAPLQLAPTNLTFTEVISEPLPAVQRLNVIAPGLAWQAAITPTVGNDWLIVLPASGNGNRLLVVELKPNPLPPGIYQTNIRVSDSAEPLNQTSAHVTLIVQPQVTGGATAVAYLPLVLH